MELAVDANVLFASLIKEGITRRILLDDRFSFYVPEFVLHEFLEHLSELEEKTKVNGLSLKRKLMEMLRLADIKVVQDEEISDFMNEACRISPDVDDVAYFALALKLKCPIWSNDKKLKEQDKVKVYSTEEIINLLF